MIARAHIIPVFVPHLGCPHSCVFCNQRKITGTISQPTKETVKEAITKALPKIPEGANIQLAFYGGSFTAIPAHKQEELLGAVLPFLHNGNISSIRLSTRPDAIDEETLKRLKDFGVSTIELGSQSMDDDVLSLSGRGHSAEQTRAAARQIKSQGFELILQMMTGLPGDTKEKTLYTASELIRLEPDGVRIYPTVVVANTELFNMWKDGSYKEHTVEEAVLWCSEVLPLFESAGIPVIRLGLNPTDELSQGGAVAGAYHPALGELVRSRIFLHKAQRLLSETPHGDSVTLGVHPSKISTMVGRHRENLTWLVSQFGLRDIKVREDLSAENGVHLL